jgi:hypothetical protein
MGNTSGKEIEAEDNKKSWKSYSAAFPKTAHFFFE